eukprot:5564425-Amphidinium_carterae.1
MSSGRTTRCGFGEPVKSSFESRLCQGLAPEKALLPRVINFIQADCAAVKGLVHSSSPEAHSFSYPRCLETSLHSAAYISSRIAMCFFRFAS